MGGVTSTRTPNLRGVLETEIEHKADPPDSSMRIAPPPGHLPPTHRTMPSIHVSPGFSSFFGNIGTAVELGAKQGFRKESK